MPNLVLIPALAGLLASPVMAQPAMIQSGETFQGNVEAWGETEEIACNNVRKAQREKLEWNKRENGHRFTFVSQTDCKCRERTDLRPSQRWTCRIDTTWRRL